MSAAGGPARTLRDATGSALLGVMMLTMMLAAITVAITLSGQTELLVARSDETSAQARAAAHAGLNHAVDLTLAHLEDWQANGFASASDAVTALLEGPDGAVGASGTDADNGSLESLGLPRPPEALPLAGTFGVSYEARVLDEDDPARGVTLSTADVTRIGENGNPHSDTNSGVVVRAIGYGPSDTSVTLEATIGAEGLPALLVNGSLRTRGRPTIGGAGGSVHANGNMRLFGAPRISGSATASGRYRASRRARVGGRSGGGHAPAQVSAIQAEPRRQDADYIMGATGLVSDADGQVVCDASTNRNRCRNEYGWTFNGAAGWAYTNRRHGGATFYLETDARLPARLGSRASPIPLTLFAEGSIDVTGRPYLQPRTGGVVFLTNEDLRVRGRGSFVIQGQILVREQIRIQRRATLVGQITVEDAASASNLVRRNLVAGRSTITFAGGGGQDLEVIAWREVR